MSALPDEEPSAELRAMAGELLMLFRTSGSAVDWSQGAHTRALAAALAVIAVAVPHTLKAWMREVWYQPDHSIREHSPLSALWLSQIARLIAGSPAKSYWQKQFLEWMSDETGLSLAGARGLAEICSLTDPCVAPLVERVMLNPTDASLASLEEFIRCHARSAHFAAATQGQESSVEAIDSWSRRLDLPPELRETLERAKRDIQAAAA
jgi:hypothetical protein